VIAANLLGDDWFDDSTRPGFSWRRIRVAGERLAGSLYELAPGERTWPYHYHWGNEEWLIALSGTPTLRTPDGERELRAGDVVCFSAGPGGAHQVVNRSNASVRVFIVSTLNVPSSAVYPDSDKVSVRWSRDEALLFRRGDAVDYWEGEG
jgi:uncharacterized cupin superfamily protein